MLPDDPSRLRADGTGCQYAVSYTHLDVYKRQIYSTAGSIDGVIDRIEEEMGETCTLVSTGGLAKVIIPYCHHKIIIDDQLLLKGLMVIYNKNRAAS